MPCSTDVLLGGHVVCIVSLLFEAHGQLIGGAAGYFYLFKTKNIIIKNKK